MNVYQFFFQLVSPFLTKFAPSELESISGSLDEKWSQTNKEKGILKIFTNPFVVIALGLLAPIVVRFIQKKASQWLQDMDNDGDVDPLDAVLAIADKIRQSRDVE